MIKSMTGFASLSRDDASVTIGLTVRSVNHRFLDLQLRLPSTLADLESALRALVQQRVSRGRVELTVTLQWRQTPTPQVELHEEFARAVSAAIDVARARGLVSGELTPGDLLRLPQALVIREKVGDGTLASEEVGNGVLAAVADGLESLDAMRVREGAHLGDDLAARRAELGRLIQTLAGAADAGRLALEARLRDRVAELMAMMPADPTAVAQEIVRTAQRSDITEEVTRFTGHLDHWDALVRSEEPCGRKLDFLIQEMNREVNTIASKADGLLVSEAVIQAKAELERVREQVQNVE
ncbi:MAG: YicC/YloC family endoribonuclease [Acidobacteriota bacterium]